MLPTLAAYGDFEASIFASILWVHYTEMSFEETCTPPLVESQHLIEIGMESLRDKVPLAWIKFQAAEDPTGLSAM